ncbi:MAG: 3-hydroxyacyl-ACP dehydratase FabZ [Oscillospiraceae bacterium]|nr:3-hydroxyacyl-ACP dehydratase FabZ [Oscillospiraceae bacterium]
MNREELKQILPHREPMLLVDEAELLPDGTARGSYTVRGDEWFLQGHFPGNPTVPGVILCEMMGQACSVMLAEKLKGKTPYFTGLDKVKFHRPVKPGDKLEISCKETKEYRGFYFTKCRGTVNGKTAVAGELSFAIVG